MNGLKKTLLAAVTAIIVGGIVVASAATPGVADGVSNTAASTSNDQTATRVGKIVEYDSQNISVLFAAGASYSVYTNIAYVKTYQPVLGDYVMLQKYANQWIVIGALSYNIARNNVLPNPSFESDPVQANYVPVNWTYVHSSGTANTLDHGVSTVDGEIIDGSHALYMSVQDTSGTVGALQSSHDYFATDAFSVTPNETWVASAYVRFSEVTLPTFLTNASSRVTLSIYFYTSPSDAVLSPVSSYDVNTVRVTASQNSWLLLTLTTTATAIPVPTGATYARVVLESLTWVSSDQGVFGVVYYDGVVARKLTNADGSFTS